MFSDQPSIPLSWTTPCWSLVGHVSRWEPVLKNNSSEVISHQNTEVPTVNHPARGGASRPHAVAGGPRDLGRLIPPKLNYIRKDVTQQRIHNQGSMMEMLLWTVVTSCLGVTEQEPHTPPQPTPTHILPKPWMDTNNKTFPWKRGVLSSRRSPWAGWVLGAGRPLCGCHTYTPQKSRKRTVFFGTMGLTSLQALWDGTDTHHLPWHQCEVNCMIPFTNNETASRWSLVTPMC